MAEQKPDDIKERLRIWFLTNFDYDDIWRWLETEETGREILRVLDRYPEAKDLGKVFYETTHDLMFKELLEKYPSEEMKAVTNMVRAYMVYSFLCGLYYARRRETE